MCTSKNFYVERCYCNSPLEYREWLKQIQENRKIQREKESDKSINKIDEYNCCKLLAVKGEAWEGSDENFWNFQSIQVHSQRTDERCDVWRERRNKRHRKWNEFKSINLHEITQISSSCSVPFLKVSILTRKIPWTHFTWERCFSFENKWMKD